MSLISRIWSLLSNLYIVGGYLSKKYIILYVYVKVNRLVKCQVNASIKYISL